MIPLESNKSNANAKKHMQNLPIFRYFRNIQTAFFNFLLYIYVYTKYCLDPSKNTSFAAFGPTIAKGQNEVGKFKIGFNLKSIYCIYVKGYCYIMLIESLCHSFFKSLCKVLVTEQVIV